MGLCSGKWECERIGYATYSLRHLRASVCFFLSSNLLLPAWAILETMDGKYPEMEGNSHLGVLNFSQMRNKFLQY